MACAKVFADVLNPKRIYLFGSYARGDYNEHSDYDFYIIMDDSVKLDGNEAVRARMAVPRALYRRPMDIIVDSESVFVEKSKDSLFVDYYVRKEGIVLYEKQDKNWVAV